MLQNIGIRIKIAVGFHYNFNTPASVGATKGIVMKNKSGNKRGLHGNQGTKKKADPRNNRINIRFNNQELEAFNQHWRDSGLSQRKFILFLLNKLK
jgi:hypothetical protein